MTTKMTDAQFIKKTRRAYGLTQQQFGDKFHVTRQTVQNWEYGKELPAIAKMAIKLRAEKDGVEIE